MQYTQGYHSGDRIHLDIAAFPVMVNNSVIPYSSMFTLKTVRRLHDYLNVMAIIR